MRTGMTVSYVGDRRVQLIHVNTEDHLYKVGETVFMHGMSMYEWL